jgi:YVTN family beta-propeller protein
MSGSRRLQPVKPHSGPGNRLAAVILILSCAVTLVALGGCTSPGIRRHGANGASPLARSQSPSATAPAAAPPSAAATHADTNIYGSTLPGHLNPAVKGLPERVYVPDSESASVDVINPGTFKVVAHYRVGQYPEHITPSWNMHELYADNTYSNSLTVIDPRTGRSTGKVVAVTDPYNLYFTPDGRKAIAVAERYQRLDFYDARSWRRTRSVAIPAAGPDHLDFSTDGKSLICSTEYSGWVFRVSTTSMRVTGRSHVGGLPVDVRLSPDGSAFYIANQSLGGVTVLDAKTLRRIKFIATGAGAHGLVVSRNTRYLYVSDRLAGKISVISFAQRKVVATWRVGGSPDMMQVSPVGSQLWVTNRFNASVSVIDTVTGRVLHVIHVGLSPHGLAFFPQPGRFSLGHNGVYR